MRVTLSEGEWWHGRLDISQFDGLSPLAFSVRVLRASHCSEGTNDDSSCRFGLKLFGTPFPNDFPEHPAREGNTHSDGLWVRSSQNGGPYALIASACQRRDATNHSYYVNVWGWDGKSELSLLAEPVSTVSGTALSSHHGKTQR